MFEEIKVSLVVAIYRSEPFLPKLLESIVNQTHENMEVLLMDDGSPDGSGAICDSFASRDERIRVIHRENGGACAARNQGLSLVTGDYVSVIDGDDWLAGDYIDYLLGLAIENHAEMSMTDTIFTTRDQVQVHSDNVRVVEAEEAVCQLIYPVIPIGPWSKLYKTSLIRDNDISFCLPWSGEGLNFSVMAAWHSERVCIGHRKVYNYRLNNAGSGLTNYSLEMGTNALSNIIETGRMLEGCSESVSNAVNWHIWKNHCYTLFLVIATDSYSEKSELYSECRAFMRSHLFDVLIHAKVGPREKLSMICRAVMPRYYALRRLRKERTALANDTME